MGRLTVPNSEAAAIRMYDAEIALHIARQTGVDPWIAAAADRLHEAIAAHLAVCSAGARPDQLEDLA